MTIVTVGKRAPGFQLKGTDGKQYEFKGNGPAALTVLSFFKNTCPTCQLTVPYLEKMYQTYKGLDVHFWGIEQDPAEQSREFARQYGLSFSVLPETAPYPVSNSYDISIVPTIFLIDDTGQVLSSTVSFVKQELKALSQEIAKRVNTVPAEVFGPNDTAPALKPG